MSIRHVYGQGLRNSKFLEGCQLVLKVVASVPSSGYTQLMLGVKKVSFKPRDYIYRYLISIDYMNGFRCNVTNVTSTTLLAEPKIPRRCGPDPENNR